MTVRYHPRQFSLNPPLSPALRYKVWRKLVEQKSNTVAPALTGKPARAKEIEMAVTSVTIKIHKAESLEDMHQIARNQIRHLIADLKGRIENIETLSQELESITGWDSYKHVAADVISYGDVPEAVRELGEYYEAMKAGPGGGYF